MRVVRTRWCAGVLEGLCISRANVIYWRRCSFAGPVPEALGALGVLR